MESYEKKYKEALELARDYYKANLTLNKADENAVLEDIFPELAESEDEKIRNSIIENLKGNMYRADGDYDLLNKQIAWLEKQGEKPQGKSALEAANEEKIDNQNCVKGDGKTGQKFKVDDWIVDKSGFVQQVLDFRGGIYTCTYSSFTTGCESNYHLWTIEDAKDGDVLAAGEKWTCIFKSTKGNNFSSYCWIDTTGYFFSCGSEAHTLDDRINGKLHPATKEQRDTFFEKMKEAGYIFDFEKKKLKAHKQWKPKSGYASPYDNDTKLIYSLLEQLKQL